MPANCIWVLPSAHSGLPSAESMKFAMAALFAPLAAQASLESVVLNNGLTFPSVSFGLQVYDDRESILNLVACCFDLVSWFPFACDLAPALPCRWPAWFVS